MIDAEDAAVLLSSAVESERSGAIQKARSEYEGLLALLEAQQVVDGCADWERKVLQALADGGVARCSLTIDETSDVMGSFDRQLARWDEALASAPLDVDPSTWGSALLSLGRTALSLGELRLVQAALDRARQVVGREVRIAGWTGDDELVPSRLNFHVENLAADLLNRQGDVAESARRLLVLIRTVAQYGYPTEADWESDRLLPEATLLSKFLGRALEAGVCEEDRESLSRRHWDLLQRTYSSAGEEGDDSNCVYALALAIKALGFSAQIDPPDLVDAHIVQTEKWIAEQADMGNVGAFVLLDQLREQVSRIRP